MIDDALLACSKVALADCRAKRRKTPHQRIMDAAAAGRGMRLSVDEVWSLSQDDAIRQCAINDTDGTDDR